jgi:CheY-like chemotaxis protein
MGRSLDRGRFRKLLGDLDSVHEAADRIHVYARKLRLAALAMADPEEEACALATSVQRVRYRLLASEPSHGSRLRTGKATGQAAVAGSAFEALLAELAANALEFTAGPVEIRASTDGERIRVSVSDDGPAQSDGPAREQWSEPGVSAAGRLGLGLPLVRAATERLGGRLDLQPAEAGAGTVMVLELPASQGSATATSISAATRGRVLVIDDMPVVCQVARRVLEAEEWSVQEAQDPGAAAEAVRFSAPDAILLDLHLGGASGFALARQLRDQGYMGALLGFTASEPEEIREEGGEDCDLFDAFVRKSGSLEDLAEQVEHCLAEALSLDRSLAMLRGALLRMHEDQEPARRVRGARRLLREVRRLSSRMANLET